MVSADLRRVMLAAEGAGRLAGEGVRTASAEHAVCGDRLELDLEVGDGRILDLAWRAVGCPATMAVAAVSHRLRGCAAREAPAVFEALIRDLGGLDRAEQHAQRLYLDVLREALDA